MPGAAGLVAANSIYRAGRPDGLTVVNFQGTQVMGQILGREGVEFDARKFEWIGAPTRENAVCALTRASGITSAQQWAASKTPVKLGSVAPGGATHDVPRILQAALGLPIHLVRGYKGTAEIRLAAQSGEIAGGCWPWESLRPTWRQALDAGEATVVLQVSEKRLPDLPGVPMALDLARTDEARQLIHTGIIVPTTVSRLYALPPATPADRVRTLRAAFLKTLSDPEFVNDARQAQLDIDPVAGEEVERLVGEMFRTPPAGPGEAQGAAPLSRPQRPAVATGSVGGLHPVETQELEQRHVLGGEQHGRLGAQVGVGVARPRRDHEEVARLPLEGLIVHGRGPPPAHDAIDGGARLAVGARADARTQELQVARDGRTKRRAAGRIDVLQQDVVEGIGGACSARFSRAA